ncbi:MAG: hypothetical protein A2033_00950, partial [Bacteroidetes bacterium GWA2_31_9]
MELSKLILLLTFLISGFCSFSQNAPAFIENKNQWNKNVLYKVELNNGSMFLEKDGFTYNFFKEEDLKHSHADENILDKSEKDHSEVIHWHAFNVKLMNAQSNCVIEALNPYSDYINYFIGNEPSKWASKVKRYKDVLYNNVYQGIDLKLYSNESNLKYDFIVKAGADITEIILQYNGVDDLKLKNGDLIIKTSVKQIIEMKPVAWQLISGEKQEVKCNFKLRDNKLSFDFPNGYDKNEILIIDPELIFSTYSGSTTDNWGFTATYDAYGNVYSGGIVEETGYPFSLGAYQTSNAGLWDVGIIKYNPSGTSRLYATYLGGSGCEMPHSLVVNEYNELHIFGTTGSSDFPVTSSAFDKTFNGGPNTIYDNTIYFTGGSDIYVSKLSEDGSSLLASTFIGGSDNDGLNYKPYMNWNSTVLMHGNDSLYYNYADGARGEIIIDGKNNIYVGSCSFSNDFPITSGAFQQNNSGLQEGVVFKLNYDLSNLVWSSYIGGSSDDAIYSIETDNNYNVFVAGGTNSSDFPTTANSYSPNYNGGTADGFIANISSNGNSIVSSTFFGSNTYDQAFFVRSDKNNNIFITGQTKASGSTLIYNANYSISNSGQFIAKFNNNLNNLIWSTVFGSGNGRPNISLTAFTVDVCSRVYVSGWGREWAYVPPYSGGWASISGTKNMQVTNDAFQNTTDGKDFYIMVMSDDASSLDYATFFGENHDSNLNCGRDHVDGGTSRFDKKGNIYQSVCASCGSCNAFPTFPNPGVWSPNNGAAPYNNNCNNAVFRFSFMDDFSVADFIAPPVICENSNYTFVNQSFGVNYFWNFGDGSTSTIQDPTHSYLNSGTYDVTLIASDTSTCNIADTITKQITVISNSVDTLANAIVCPGETQQIGISPLSNPSITYTWIPTTSLSNPNISNPIANPTQTTLYQLLISNDSCTNTLFQLVEVKQNNFVANAPNTDTICKGQNINLSANSNSSSSSFVWATDLGFNNTISSSINDSTITVNPNISQMYYVNAQSQNCNFNSIDSVLVNVIVADVLASNDTIICQGNSAILNASNLISTDNVSFLWSPSNSITNGINTSSPTVLPGSTTNFIVEATNQLGCKDFDTVKVEIDSLPLSAYSSNALCNGICDGSIMITPNGVSPYNYQWNISGNSSTLSNVCEGVYIVTVTDALGCINSTSVTITQPAPIIATTASTGTTCNAGTGSITINASGGTGVLEYSIDNVNFQSSNVFNSLFAGSYVVSIRDENNCIIMLTETVTQPDAIVVSNTADSTTCYAGNDGSIIVNATGGTGTLQFSIDGTNFNTTSQFNGLTAGNYTITIKDANGCITTSAAHVSSPNNIASIVSVTNPMCYGETGSISLSSTGGTGALQYSIDGINFQSSNVFSGLTANNYIITIKDSHNCISTTNANVIQPNVVNAIANVNNVPCYGGNGSITINSSGGTGSHLYSIDGVNFQVSNVFANLPAESYTITVKDANSCTKTLNKTITQPQQLLTLINDTIVTVCDGTCNGTISATVIGGTLPYYYLWNNNQNSQTISNLCVGKYYVTIYDNNNCIVKDSILLKDLSDLASTLVKTGTIDCYGECSGSLLAQGINGQPSYQYTWSNGQTTESISNLCVGVYYVTVKDALNCIRIRFANLMQPAEMNSVISNGTIICNGQSTIMSVSVAGGSQPYSYLWSDAQNQQTQIAYDLHAGVYTVTITDGKGCSKTVNSTLTEPDKLVLSSVKEDVICKNACDGFINLELSGGVPPYSYLWNNLSNTDSIIDLCSGNYTVSVSDKLGCSMNESFDIFYGDYVPPLNANSDDSIIFIGQSTNLHSTINQDYIYAWDNSEHLSNSFISNPVASPLATTLYVITVTDKNGCVNTDSVLVIVRDFVCDEPFVYVPNAFSPNADGNNDILYVYSNI